MIWLPGKRRARATCCRSVIHEGPSERINKSALDPALIHIGRKVHVTGPTRACLIPTIISWYRLGR